MSLVCDQGSQEKVTNGHVAIFLAVFHLCQPFSSITLVNYGHYWLLFPFSPFLANFSHSQSTHRELLSFVTILHNDQSENFGDFMSILDILGKLQHLERLGFHHFFRHFQPFLLGL